MWNSAAEQNGSDQGHVAFKPSYLIRCACELTKPLISRFLGTKFFSAFSTSLRRRQQSVKHYVIRRQSPEGFWANETLNFETNLTNLSACEAEGRRQKAEGRRQKAEREERENQRQSVLDARVRERGAEKEKGGAERTAHLSSRQTTWLFAGPANELNWRRHRKTPAIDHCKIYIQKIFDFQVLSPNHSAKLP